MRREAVLWGGAVVIAVGVLLLAWRLPIGRPAPTPDSPYAEMEVVRHKGAPEAPDFSLPTLEGQTVTLRVVKIDGEKRRMGLSLKRVASAAYADTDWEQVAASLPDLDVIATEDR